MAQFVETPTKTFTAGGALAIYRRVKLNSAGKLEYAGASDTDAIGVLEQAAFADGDVVAVRLRTAQGTTQVVCSAAVALSDTLYAAADGKVATSGTVLVGKPVQAGSGDGSIIEAVIATTAVLGSIARSALTLDDMAEYTIPLTSLRVHDAMATNLPGVAANDDMAIVTGTPGTAAPTLQGVDFGGTTSDEKGAFEFTLPPEYVAGQTVTLSVIAGMLTTVSDGTATLDAEVWKSDEDATVGADLCTTAAQSINSLTLAAKTFTITPTTLAVGDHLIVRLSFAGSDTGNVGPMIPLITKVSMLLDIKG